MRPPTLDTLPDPPPDRSGWPWTHAPEPLSTRRSDGEECPRISVVTPSYNQGAFIEETIRSILLQGYPSLEYIVIDGGSTDATQDILEKYDPWLDYWVSESDDGQSDAINKGLERATGSIFNWINSDDLLEPGALKVIGRHFENTDAVIGLGRHFTEEESWIEDTYNFAPKPLLRGFGREEGCGFTQQAVWLRTDQVRDCGGIDPSFHYAMDRELYVRYTYHYPRVTYVDEPLARFRIHDASKTETSGLGERADNAFKRDFLRLVEKIRSDDAYAALHDLCDHRAEVLKWEFFVAQLKRETDRSSVVRAAELFLRTFLNPRVRLSRASLGVAVRILFGFDDETPLLAYSPE